MSVDPQVVQPEPPAGPPALELIVTGRAVDRDSDRTLREEIVARAVAMAEAEVHAAVTALTERLAAAGAGAAGDTGGSAESTGSGDGAQRRRSATLRAIIDNNIQSEEAAARAAAAAGLDMSVPHAIIAFTAPADCSSTPVTRRLELAERLFERGTPDAVPLRLGVGDVPHAGFVVPAQPSNTPRRAHRATGSNPAVSSVALLHSANVAEQVADMHRLCAVVTEPGGGIAGLRSRERAARIMVALVHREGVPHGIVRERDHLLDVLLGSVAVDAGDAFVQSVLGPVLALSPSRAEPLLETLGELLGARGGFAAAARRLRVHRETVKYRMGRLTELTGYSLADPVQRTHLDLALRLGRFCQH